MIFAKLKIVFKEITFAQIKVYKVFDVIDFFSKIVYYFLLVLDELVFGLKPSPSYLIYLYSWTYVETMPTEYLQ